MAYKISDKAVIVNEGGESVLIADELYYQGGITISSTTNTLSPTYITDYFTSPYTFQGSTSGYTSGGTTGPTAAGQTTIDKFPFSSNANATDVGDLQQARQRLAGQTSETHGYSSGGLTNPQASSTVIDKFSFSSDARAPSFCWSN